jgi:phosphate uptake regulator
MQRKVIQIADSTQLVSLPRQWVLKNNIKKGESLEIEEFNNALIIKILASSGIKEKKLELTIKSKDKFTPKQIISPYIQGFTELDVHYDDAEVFKLISEQLQYIIGFEIISQGSNNCTIKSISTELDNDIDNIINRVFLSSISMMREVIDAASKSDTNRLCNLNPLELTNNKLSYFCLRILNKEGYKNDPGKTTSIYYIIWSVEEIVDDLKELCDYISRNRVVIDKQILSISKKILSNFESAYKLFKQIDNQVLCELDRNIQNLQSEIKPLVKKCRNTETFILALLYKINTGIGHILKEITY